MIALRGCPRCAGALVPDGDDARHCLTCGYVEISARELARAYAEPAPKRGQAKRKRQL